MVKAMSLFGQYLQKEGKNKLLPAFDTKQISRMLPPKVQGKMPSAASQMALYHDDDINNYTKVTRVMERVTFKTEPVTFKKDFRSHVLNTTLWNQRVTPSAIYSMDDAGGFDNYIMRTAPEELRSCAAEKMRNLAYFYQENPEYKKWGLPWKTLMRKKDQKDPEYARYKHMCKKVRSEKKIQAQHAPFSPYYLPKDDAAMHVERNDFLEGSETPKLNLWWRESPQLEAAFRKRLTHAKSYDHAHPDHREIDGFFMPCRSGNMGGGKRGKQYTKRGKGNDPSQGHSHVWKPRELRPY